jgi:hypothetical protein
MATRRCPGIPLAISVLHSMSALKHIRDVPRIACDVRESPILLKNSLGVPIRNLFCAVSATTYPQYEGIAAYSVNPVRTALRWAEVASNSESAFEKNSGEF